MILKELVLKVFLAQTKQSILTLLRSIKKSMQILMVTTLMMYRLASPSKNAKLDKF
jgi:hypothetical protein